MLDEIDQDNFEIIKNVCNHLYPQCIYPNSVSYITGEEINLDLFFEIAEWHKILYNFPYSEKFLIFITKKSAIRLTAIFYVFGYCMSKQFIEKLSDIISNRKGTNNGFRITKYSD